MLSYTDIFIFFKNIPIFLINWLNYKLTIASLFYYKYNFSIISDFDYDYLYKKFVILKKKYSSKYKYNFNFSKDFINKSLGKNKHILPMLSLYSSSNFFDILFFARNIFDYLSKFFVSKRIIYFCDFKFDGVALSIIYKNGFFYKASTRGDGVWGEDVTYNVSKIKSVPKKLNIFNVPNLLEVRGEIIIKKKSFLNIKNFYKENIKCDFSNIRNAASGILRQVKTSYYLNFLIFYAHSIGYIDKSFYIKNQGELINLYKKCGFKVSSFFFYVYCFYDIYYYFKKCSEIRRKLNYNIDGLVFKINDFEQQNKIGFSDLYPKFSFAYKFYDNYATTTLLKIIFNVGRTGVITPIGILDPININGVVFSKVNLYNFNEILIKNINIKDCILLYISGDIIPYVMKVVKKVNNEWYTPPNNCPICYSKVIFENNYKSVRCIGSLSCSSQIKNKLKHFCSKNAFNISNLNSKAINIILKKYVLKNITNIFSIKYEDLKLLKYCDQIILKKFLISIKKSFKISLSRFIYSLGINYVGFSLSKKISLFFKKFNFIINSKKKDLCSVKGVTEVISNSIFFFFNEFNNRLVIYNLFFFITINSII